MFFLFVFGESQLSSLFSTSGDGISAPTVLCVIAVTVPLVLLTLLCVCWKQTLVLNPDVKKPPAVTADAPLSSSQLQLVTTGDVTKNAEDANHNSSKRESEELTASLTDGAVIPIQDSLQHDLMSASPECVSDTHSSPGLPPRNPQRLFSTQASNPANSGQPGILPPPPASPASLPPTAEGRTPVEDHLTPDNPADNPDDNPSSDRGLYSVITDDSQPQGDAVPDVAEDADYAEVDFQERSNLNSGQTTSAAADRQYDYIDLKAVETVDVDSVSYAEVNRNDATCDNKPTNEVPWYAKVDREKNRHSFSAGLLGNAPGEERDPDTKTVGSSQRKNFGSHDALYTAVNKSEAVKTDRHEDSSSPSGSRAQNFLSDDGCGASYGRVGAGSRVPGSGADFSPPVPSKNFEGPGYSVVRDESKTDREEPGYSSIDEEPKVNSDDPDYSVIEDVRARADAALPRPDSGPENNSDGLRSAEAIAGADDPDGAKEPLYEDVRFDSQSCLATSPNSLGPADVVSKTHI